MHTCRGLQGWLKPVACHKMGSGWALGDIEQNIHTHTHTAGDLGVVQPLHNSLAGQSNLSLSINILLKQHTKRERVREVEKQVLA